MSEFSSITKRIMVVGIIILCGFGMYQDMATGKELALITIAGMLGLLKGGE